MNSEFVINNFLPKSLFHPVKNYVISSFENDLPKNIAKGLLHCSEDQHSLHEFIKVWVSMQVHYGNEVLSRIPNSHKFIRVGDYHNNQRATIQIEDQNKNTYIYKPISPKSVLFLNAIYGILNSEFNFSPIKIFRLWDDAYLCEQIVDNATDFDGDEFSYHYGAICALAYIFRITDLHKDNVICQDSVPIIVDSETLFYPEIPAIKSFTFSATLLFPSKFNQRAPVAKYTNIKLTKLAEGLEACLERLDHNRAKINEFFNDFSQTIKTRIIFKPTIYYLNLIYNSLHSSFIMDPSKRSTYIRNCLNGKHVITRNISNHEYLSLEKLDVPYFYYQNQSIRSIEGALINIPAYRSDFFEAIKKPQDTLKSILSEIEAQSRC